MHNRLDVVIFGSQLRLCQACAGMLEDKLTHLQYPVNDMCSRPTSLVKDCLVTLLKFFL